MRTAPIYIFNHLPRTGGGSLLAALSAVRPVVHDYLPADEPGFATWRANPLRLDDITPGTIVAGHYTARGARLHERYPETADAARFRLITFLRQPGAWCRSHLCYFGASVTHDAVNARGAERGVFARALAASDDPIASLDRYWFVGLAERAQADGDRLFARLDHAPHVLPPANRSPRVTLTPSEQDFVEAYERRAVVDHALYERAMGRERDFV